jgi:hypothetical protein
MFLLASVLNQKVGGWKASSDLKLLPYFKISLLFKKLECGGKHARSLLSFLLVESRLMFFENI